MLHPQTNPENANNDQVLSFVWLELTNRCNLECTHCYAESGPHTGDHDILGRSDYERLIREAADIGCRQIQFIGGEPTLNRDLPHFIEVAAEAGYSFIEVFTNLTRLLVPLVACFKKYGVHVATSVYAAEPATHDAVTQVRGSFDRTVRGLRTLLEAEIPVRAGIIEMEQNAGRIESTIQFLNDVGVTNVGVDRLRHFGRGMSCEEDEQIAELCGSCAGSTLCVAPDGRVSPCIMSKKWSVGSCRDTPLESLVLGDQLRSVRNRIYNTVVMSRQGQRETQAQWHCDPAKPCFPCSPEAQCPPCRPNTTCGPNTCRPYCMPN